MIVVTQIRDKCIGCNYCVELAPVNWRMSKKDGKSTLLESVNKKGFHTAKLPDELLEENIRAANACPVKIIKVSQV